MRILLAIAVGTLVLFSAQHIKEVEDPPLPKATASSLEAPQQPKPVPNKHEPVKEPVKKAPEAPKRVVYSIGCEQYRPLVAQYGWSVSVAMAVMKAESGCNPNAISPTNDHGLFQLNRIPIYEPAANIRYAYYNKYLKGGWSHWTVCNKGIVS